MNYIFLRGNLLERAGGPSTYLYNLKIGLEQLQEKNIKFIYDEKIKTDNQKKQIKKYKEKVAKFFPKIYGIIMLKHSTNDAFHKRLKEKKDIDLIHFHSVVDLTNSIGYIPSNTIKILTSHCPENPAIEFRNRLKAKTLNKKCNFKGIEKKYYTKYVKKAFQEADILVFPSKEAMEPYYETCPEFEDLINAKDIRYILTGTQPLEYKKSREDFRKENNITKDAFVLCFIGRHNEVKGYDNFIKMATEAMEKEKNIYVITAGIGEIESPKNERWIDIGWTNDPGSVVNAADLFVLPNKRTYFDLILLEVLSIGKTCLVSNTGGNKTVEKLSKGVLKYNNIDEAIHTILDLYQNREKLKDLEKENKKVYEEYFTVDKFAKNYIEMIESIKRDKEKENNNE